MKKEYPYYLGNDECLPTRLTLQTTDTTISQDLPWDVTISDLCNAFFAACIGITFDPKMVLDAMKKFAEERLIYKNED